MHIEISPQGQENSGCELRVVGYGVRVTGYRLRVAGCGLRVTGSEAVEGNTSKTFDAQDFHPLGSSQMQVEQRESGASGKWAPNIGVIDFWRCNIDVRNTLRFFYRKPLHSRGYILRLPMARMPE